MDFNSILSSIMSLGKHTPQAQLTQADNQVPKPNLQQAVPFKTSSPNMISPLSGMGQFNENEKLNMDIINENARKMREYEFARTHRGQQMPAEIMQQQPSNIIGDSSGRYQHQIPVEGLDGKGFVPPNIAQLLMESFNDIGEATNAAQVLKHPKMQTYGAKEFWDDKNQKWKESWNYGENPEYKPEAWDVQENGSIDYGLMRNNSGTYNDMMNDPYWANEIKNIGINNFEDVKDMAKSIKLGRLTLQRGNYDRSKENRISDNPEWRQWFAAPLELRYR